MGVRTAQQVWENRWYRDMSPMERKVYADMLRDPAYRRKQIEQRQKIYALTMEARSRIDEFVVNLFVEAGKPCK